MIKKNSKIFVTGHKGLVGSAIIRKLKEKGYNNILTVNKFKLDLRDQKKVVNEPVKLEQDYRDFDFDSPWEGTKYIKKEKNK